MKIGIEVLNELNVANFVDITQRFDRKRAFTRAGLAVETSARRKAPHRTGHLRRNIVSVVYGAYSKNPADTYAEIGVDLNVVPYAWYQEAGTSRMQAHPYLRPALASRRPAIIAIFKDEINKAIKKGA
jgi:HK97 gp10 family phage protein